jgi:ketosteroid isomerase-like protein
MRHVISHALLALCLDAATIFANSAPASGGEDGAPTIIARRLSDWTDAFNAREAAAVCDLFSPDLISTMQGRPDEGRDAVCDRIARTLADRRLSIHYVPHIKEIIVSGELAVVRLVWSVKTRIGLVTKVSEEPGIDIFRLEADGNWRITRFLAFSVMAK